MKDYVQADNKVEKLVELINKTIYIKECSLTGYEAYRLCRKIESLLIGNNIRIGEEFEVQGDMR